MAAAGEEHWKGLGSDAVTGPLGEITVSWKKTMKERTMWKVRMNGLVRMRVMWMFWLTLTLIGKSGIEIKKEIGPYWSMSQCHRAGEKWDSQRRGEGSWTCWSQG